MSLTASEKDWGQASEERSEVEGHTAFQDELVRFLTRAVSDLGLEWEKADEQARSKLDSWFLDSGHRAAAPRKRAPFLPDLHEEVAKVWAAPQSARTRAGESEIFTKVEGVEAGVTPPVEESIAAHLCPSSASLKSGATLPSRPCHLTAHIADKAYTTSGEAVSALHTMVVLQVFHAQLLKSLDEGKEDPEVFKDLRCLVCSECNKFCNTLTKRAFFSSSNDFGCLHAATPGEHGCVTYTFGKRLAFPIERRCATLAVTQRSR
ncbi:guanylate cyclase 2G-like protein [Labeo rohita]|uniref:Guanylate cyclase 2G-like protein n=1 Tax=Labeo rohita TaxID=84645 RepID=A0A498LR31_LABRO|nr:guanylate cyclase 2G-like protein [Labeo rohita]